MSIFRKIIFGILIFIFLLCGFLFIGKSPQQEKIIWGATFSQKHAQDLGLDWQETYLSILDDLQVKHLRLIAYWDLIEPENNQYHFDALDSGLANRAGRKTKRRNYFGCRYENSSLARMSYPAMGEKFGKTRTRKKVTKIY
jgi:hypothetical protein